MSVSPLWLRAVLSIAVIFNGSLATAGSMVGMSHAGEAASTTTDTTSAKAGSGHCQEDNVAAVDASVIEGTASKNHDGTPDCCKAGACQCACVHATATVDFVAVTTLNRADTPPPLFAISDAIAQPVARLDRPPIA